MRFTKYLGHFIFFLHFLFSIVFVYEKTLYVDAANFIFNIVNSEDFFIAAGRYGCLPPQLFTLAAVKAGLALPSIVLAYSLSYILYYYLLFNIVVYLLKNAEIGLVIAFSLLLCLRHNYFMNHCEMHMAIIYCLFLVAFMDYYYKYRPFGKALYILLVTLLITLCFFSHPAILFAVIFVLLYKALEENEMKEVKLYLFALVIGLLVLTKSLFTEQDSYEGNLMSQIFNLKQLWRTLPSVYSVTFLVSRFFSLYFFASVLGAIVLCWYYVHRYYWKMVLVAGSIAVFLLASVIIYHEGDADMMMERAYSMLVIFVMVPFMKEVFLRANGSRSMLLMLLLVGMTAVSFYGIFKTGLFYRQRVEYVRDFVKQYEKEPHRKYIVKRSVLDQEKLMVPWGFAFETLIYTSLEGPDHGKTFYVVDDLETFEYNKKDKDLFLAVPFWRDWKIEDLNPKYFRLPEEEYTVVP